MIIGVTGSIATGKSTVSHYLKNRGYLVIDSDLIARNLMTPGQPTYEQVVESFGKEILLEDGTIHRKKLGDIIFFDEKKRLLLNKIVHKDVLEEIQKIICLKHKDNDIIFVDVPLLYEAEYDTIMDQVIVVYTTLETQIKRLMKRDGIDRALALQKISSQMSLDEKRKRANHIISNEGTVYETFFQVDILLGKLKGVRYEI